MICSSVLGPFQAFHYHEILAESNLCNFSMLITTQEKSQKCFGLSVFKLNLNH